MLREVIFQPINTIFGRKGTACVYTKKFVPRAQWNLPRFSSTNRKNIVKTSSKIRWFWMPAGIGFALISFIQLRHIQERERRRRAPLEKQVSEKCISPWQVNLFKVIPTNVFSRFWGKVNDVELPVSLRGPIVRLWTWAFNCCLDEAEEVDPCKYQNLGVFFTRKLKEGVRDIDQSCELVCPVDGRVLHFGRLVDGKLEQVKGVPYSLESFLGSQLKFAEANYPTKDKCLYQCVLYLGPGDCHHFHSPTEWRIESRRHFPGELYSVSPWVLKGFPDVLCTNERVALYGNWKHGAFTMTAVGAYNVGSINIHFDNELKTNQKNSNRGSFDERNFSASMTLNRGDSVGWFAMGSAVVLIFEAPEEFEFTVRHRQKIMLGQALGIIPRPEKKVSN